MQDAREDARKFLEEFSITYLNVREAGNRTSRSYGATGIPETYFISRAGLVVAHVIGALAPRQLREGLDAAMSGRPLPPRQGGAREGAR
jgi:cytochrome c biogenesis protein CcmG/thiol:disulfide interchange protein DsbE